MNTSKCCKWSIKDVMQLGCSPVLRWASALWEFTNSVFIHIFCKDQELHSRAGSYAHECGLPFYQVKVPQTLPVYFFLFYFLFSMSNLKANDGKGKTKAESDDIGLLPGFLLSLGLSVGPARVDTVVFHTNLKAEDEFELLELELGVGWIPSGANWARTLETSGCEHWPMIGQTEDSPESWSKSMAQIHV